MSESVKYGIKDLATEDRPREKFLQKGFFALSDAELIAIIIGSGSSKESAVELAQKIMIKYRNNLNELGKATVEQLTESFHGVGIAKAVSIVAAMELGRRRSFQNVLESPVIDNSFDIFNLFLPILGDLQHEEFWVLFLNRANKIISKYNVSKGGISSTSADVRIIMKKALENNASSIVICHNHPSGKSNPSNEDINLTNRLVEAGKIMEIPLRDHLIISDNRYYSFYDNNLIK
ncbi:MAG: DNA repair protein RadC [Marinilabiliaceae bacterium]|nr:DNA repair protein RadC [Marinilabiliaceae bacterium]